MPRQLRNKGGMTVSSIRQKYGLGSLVRKLIPNELAKVAEVAAPFIAPFNPIAGAIAGGLGRYDRTGDLGSSALYGGATFGLGKLSNVGFGQTGKSVVDRLRGQGFDLGSFKGAAQTGKNVLLGNKELGTTGLFGKEGGFNLGEALGKGTPGVFLGTTALALLGQKLVGPKKEDETEGEYLQRRKTAVGGYLRKYYSQVNPRASATDVESFVQRNLVEYKAEGGRIGYASGTGYNARKRYSILIDKYNKGIPLSPSESDELEMLEMTYADESRTLDMAQGGITDIPVRMNSEGVKELDMRKSGGFVPIGVKEKADDVPAMLSKNEFVMTADAVRAAGGGSIQKGAQRMYDTMKKLESRVA